MLVQYFQRARFEWHPELAAGKRVLLTDVGTYYFLYYKEDPRDLLPSDLAPSSIVDLHIRAFVDKAVAQPETTQILYVIVQDQNLRPIQNAQVVFTVVLPSGEESRNVMDLTNEYGYTYEVFTVQGQPNGIAQVFIEATYNIHATNTHHTAYMVVAVKR
jgi:hypothetical protein